LTVGAVIEHTPVTEKELDIFYKRTLIDVLLSLLEELEEEDIIENSSNKESFYISSKTISTKSVSSLNDRSFTMSSLQKKRSTQTQRLQILLSSLKKSISDYLLSSLELDTDKLNSVTFENLLYIDVQSIYTELIIPLYKFNSIINISIEAYILSSLV
jgi:hypothetical protein